MANEMGQHKMLATGKLKFAEGGAVPFLKSGKKDTPLEMAKRSNGVPGFKNGGKVKGK